MSKKNAVESFLSEYAARSSLRLSTAGSVDDGKSTLIGRLLHDSRNLRVDQLDDLRKRSNKGNSATAAGNSEGIDFALVTDGLKAEREQGITIDVAYRYFSTPRRNFIIADTPGHEQYTRNMATGASTAGVSILLVDAQKGVTTQTRRHAFIASLLGIPRLLITVNKMDLVGYSQERFEEIRDQFQNFAVKLGIADLKFIPISALRGDNVVDVSQHMPWYHGESILEYLENVYIGSDRNLVDFRFPVQWVLRPNSNFRGYAGQVVSGRIRVNEEVMILPSQRTSRIASICTFDGELPEACPSQSVVLTLEDEIDISRGDVIVRLNNVPQVQSRFEAMVIWMGDGSLQPGKNYEIQRGPARVRAQVQEIKYCVNINSLSREPAKPLALNEIGRVTFHCHQPFIFDAYEHNRHMGGFILVDLQNHQTVAAGMIIQRLSSTQLQEKQQDSTALKRNIHKQTGRVTLEDRITSNGHPPLTVWMTGLSASGKSTIARQLERELFQLGKQVVLLDGDNLRSGLNQDLGFSKFDRRENIRRVAELAKIFNDQGVIAICALISPYEEERQLAKTIVGDCFRLVHVHAPLAVCESRDPKGLYIKARSGEIAKFTGVSDNYEEPQRSELLFPELRLDTCSQSLEECVELLKLMLIDGPSLSESD